MGNLTVQDLDQRINELEKLAWNLFRVLETYITWNELEELLKHAETTDVQEESD